MQKLLINKITYYMSKIKIIDFNIEKIEQDEMQKIKL